MLDTTEPSRGDLKEEKINDENIKLSVTLEEKILSKERFCSFELFSGSNTTAATYQQLFSEFESCCPLFYSITWHDGSPKLPARSHPSFQYFEKFSKITLLHLTARRTSRNEVMHVLNRAVEVGRANIFALQGDSEEVGEEQKAIDFPHAVDLVKFIRAKFGSKFSICVAGYPQMHPRSLSKESDLFYLKAKVDAGANFIITQIIFESQVFIEFVRDCRKVGITVPIIPGILLISSFKSLVHMSRNCDTNIPERMLQDLKSIKDNHTVVQEYALNSAAKLVEEIFHSGTATGFHLFTLNRSQLALELCKRVGLCKVEKKSETFESLDPSGRGS